MTTTTPYPAPDIAAAVARGRVAANDGPQPSLGAGRTAQEYAAMAQEFRAGVWERLEQGDMDQASKKAWKLVAETVKAISAHHGSVIYTYQAIIEVVAELAQLVGRAGDTETQKWLNTAFVAASSLQNNYYETRMPENMVRSGLRLGEELSQRLYQLFWPEGALAPARTIGVRSTMTTTTPYPAPDIGRRCPRPGHRQRPARPGPGRQSLRSKIRRHGAGVSRQRLGTSGQGRPASSVQ